MEPWSQRLTIALHSTFTRLLVHPLQNTSSIILANLAKMWKTVVLSSLLVHSTRTRTYCTFGQTCWPSDREWSALNTTVSGRLISIYPPAAACHGDHYNETLCSDARTNWTTGSWRANQPGASQQTNWENGDGRCFVDTACEDVCEQGIVPVIGVAVESVGDIQKSVKFAAKNNLYLVVKNTGHD